MTLADSGLSGAGGSAGVDLAATTDIAPLALPADGTWVVTMTVVGHDEVTNAGFGVELKCFAQRVAGVLSVGPRTASLPLYGPTFPSLAIDVVAVGDALYCRVVGDVGMVGRTADVDVAWPVFGAEV